MTPEEIRILRSKLGLKQEAIAHRIGVAYPTYNKWENGRSKPSPLSIKALKKLESDYDIRQDDEREILALHVDRILDARNERLARLENDGGRNKSS